MLRSETYIADAERAGDSELADFFPRAQEANREGADEGKGLLTRRLAGCRRHAVVSAIRSTESRNRPEGSHHRRGRPEALAVVIPVR
ncbi:hypothetical protein ACRAKI_20295 [Saccharothrix isguenensis]